MQLWIFYILETCSWVVKKTDITCAPSYGCSRSVFGNAGLWNCIVNDVDDRVAELRWRQRICERSGWSAARRHHGECVSGH